MTATKAILIIFTFAVFLSNSVYGAPEVRVSEGIVSGSEPFTNLSITLSEAPNGLSGYNITISLSNASIAEINSVDFPDWALLNSVGLLPAESVWIKAVDLQNSIIKGASNVILANVTLRGKSEGIARVLLTVRQIDDDDGGGAPSDEDFKNIGFDAKTSEGSITAKIEYLKGRPKKAAFDAPGSVFKYFNAIQEKIIDMISGERVS